MLITVFFQWVCTNLRVRLQHSVVKNRFGHPNVNSAPKRAYWLNFGCIGWKPETRAEGANIEIDGIDRITGNGLRSWRNSRDEFPREAEAKPGTDRSRSLPNKMREKRGRGKKWYDLLRAWWAEGNLLVLGKHHRISQLELTASWLFAAMLRPDCSRNHLSADLLNLCCENLFLLKDNNGIFGLECSHSFVGKNNVVFTLFMVVL